MIKVYLYAHHETLICTSKLLAFLLFGTFMISSIQVVIKRLNK